MTFIRLLFLVLCSAAGCAAASRADAALLAAAEQGSLSAARSALKGGANPNAQREEGSNLTALMFAARGGHPAVVRLLLGAGADPNRTASVAVGASGANDGLTALMQGAASGDVPTVQALLDKKANVNAIATFTRDGVAGKVGRPVAFHAANSAVLDLLLKSGADRNAKDAEGNTLLMYAVEHLDAPAVCLLLQSGADVSLRNTAGKTALEIAQAASNSAAITELKKGRSMRNCGVVERRKAA